jgi:hypothetical protein
VIITKAHEMAEQDSKQEQQSLQQQENPRLQSKEVVQKQQPIVKKDNLQESKKGITYGIILDDSGKIKNVEHIAKDEQELKIYFKKNYPLYEVKKIIVLKEDLKNGKILHFPHNFKNRILAGRSAYIEKIENGKAFLNMNDNSNDKKMFIPVPLEQLKDLDENSDMIMNRQQSELEENESDIVVYIKDKTRKDTQYSGYPAKTKDDAILLLKNKLKDDNNLIGYVSIDGKKLK